MKTIKGYNMGKLDSAGNKIAQHIFNGKTISISKPTQAPDTLVKGSSNTGGSVSMSRVYNEVK